MTDQASQASLGVRVKTKYINKRAPGKMISILLQYALLIGIAFVILFPFFVKTSSSLMSLEDLKDKTVKYLPRNPTLQNLSFVLKHSRYFTALRNTVIISLIAALLQTFVASFAGYGFGKFKFKGQKVAFALVMMTLLMPPQTIMTPLYLTFQRFDPLGLFSLFGGTPPNLISFDINGFPFPVPLFLLSLLGIGLKNGLFIFMMMQYYKSLPNELAEAAYVDGYGVFATYFHIMMPLAKSMLTTIFLLSFSWQCTDTFYSDLFFKNLDSLPRVLSAVGEQLAGQAIGSVEGPLLSSVYTNCAALLIVLPLALLYLFTQRFFTRGIERSGIVG